MRMLDVFRLRLRALLSRGAADSELDEELQYHLDRQMDENVAAGMSRQEAREHALVSLGGLQQRKEECRDARGMNLLDNLRADLRFALRQLRKSPAFACTAIGILGLSIGSSVATFGLVDAALLQPLPYKDPARLVGVFETAAMIPQSNLSYPDYLDWKQQNQVLASLEIYSRMRWLMQTAEGASPVRGARVSDGFFRTLGVKPVVGRDFRPGEDAPNAPRMAMLSFGSWQSRFGGRQDIEGQVVTLNGAPAIIVGVLPRDFHFAPTEPAEFWTTFQAAGECDLRRGCHSIYGVGRLKDGISAATAETNLGAIAKTLEQQYPDSNRGQGAAVVPLPEVIVGDIRPVVLLLMMGAMLLVLIASVNVASLLLVRSDSRRREFAVRSALGASAGRLVSQFAIESCLLVACGGIAGMVAGSWGMRLLVQLIPTEMLTKMPYLHAAGLNARVIAFGAAICLFAALLFSLTPALRLSLSQVRAGLAEGSRGAAGLTWRRLGSRLVVLELAIAMMLLVAAGLLGKSLHRLLQVGLGFEADRLAVLEVGAPLLGAAPNEKKVAFAREVARRVSAVQGVQSAGLTSRPPVSGNGNTDWIRFEGRPYNGEHNEVNYRVVSSEYFGTLQAKLVRGRYFRTHDGASKPRVAIINQQFAEQYFPGADPIGKRFGNSSLTPESMKEIVGVVENIREGTLEEDVWPTAYYPITQFPEIYFAVLARIAGPEQAALDGLARTMRELGTEVVSLEAATMQERIAKSPSAYMRRSSSGLVGAFAGLALSISAIGLYGVVAYSVSQRTREIGVRIAMGAERSAVYALVLKEAMALTAMGTVLGLVCSIWAATAIRKLLFEVEPWDAPTLAVVAVTLAGAALLASYLPARRAASVNPAVALRSE